ncbi:hypothetical protein CHGG_00962 [Chaetomium globosum CBS 148.51]|uniref:RRM domain-containing protein n=1 Tax=Chaetomium globosum (strain ATCC 6205 / CBS 148.51 / DSM 1962 / NBRC 6347 / NRRL 1970) TaxID=306901 RepID=Q2HFP2_CHAGB|nr:uncharacterized protein CHGG_00962 [Chaetomium globosum CBS 148.51]EAQ92727.1 hypothetical protein CHGG_00962 [Chaetomium globosum CBS 148.51]
MDRALDRSLDDILGDRKQLTQGCRTTAEVLAAVAVVVTDPTILEMASESEWVHDKFEDHDRQPTLRSQAPLLTRPVKGLFSRIGPVVTLDMKYDRAGRSEGTAFVTYESPRDAAQAIQEYDGANAAGQPIRLTLMPSGPSMSRRGNPFDSVVTGAGRPLAERITVPGQGRSRSLSPRRAGRESDEEAARRGVDRYRPRGGGGGGGSGRLSRSRSPIGSGGGRRRDGGGRRPGGRRDGGRGRGDRGGGGGGGGGERAERGGRPKKTQEELDAEMEDYFAGGSGGAQQNEGTAGSANGAAAQQQDLGEDIDMIE